MDAPFNLVDANEEIERVFPLFGSGAPAVLVQRDGQLVGVITRSDLLEFAARQPRRRD
jgi:predicted transcriptional regulator